MYPPPGESPGTPLDAHIPTLQARTRESLQHNKEEEEEEEEGEEEELTKATEQKMPIEKTMAAIITMPNKSISLL